MINGFTRYFLPLVLAAAAFAAPARADTGAEGVWIDHTGRGAVEITNCGGKLCGRVVWLKDASHNDTCGKQVIGNVAPVDSQTWDGGWIHDLDQDTKYDVELTLVGPNELQVMGYAGVKFLSETMTWKRAPADLQKCKA